MFYWELKLRHVFAILFLMTLAAFAVSQMLIQPHTASTKEGFEYSMPRPPSEVPNFDLSDREVDRQVITPEKVPVPSQAVNPPVEAKKKKNAKADDKDKKGRKVKFSADVIEEDESSLSAWEDHRTRNDGGSVTYFQPKTNSSGPTNSKGEEEEVLSLEQWRALFQKDLTMVTAQKFLAARGKGKVKDDDYFAIAFEMFLDAGADRAKIGTFLLSSDNSTRGFEIVAKQYQTVADQKQAVLWDILMNYAYPQRIGGLAHALSSKDTVVIKMATQVVSTWIKSYQDSLGQSGNAPQGGELNQQAILKVVRSFALLLPSLQGLVSMPDIGPIATTLIADIQSLPKSSDRVAGS